MEMEPEVVYENFEHEISTKATVRILQTEAKSRIHRGCSHLLWSTVCLGLLCALLLVVIIVLCIRAEREKTVLNYKEDTMYNQPINMLLANQTFEKDQLFQYLKFYIRKNLELNIRIKNVTAEKKQLQQNFYSLNQTKLELEMKVKSLSLKLKNISEGGWYYPMMSAQKNWSESRRYCRDRGGDLVIINSEEEQRFISSFRQRVWIGLSDIEKDGTMTWVNNSTLNKGFWMTDEPNNQNGNEHCVEIIPTTVLDNWNDLSCSQLRNWICEI